jgi:uncharacterized delta-60 repeat protein
MRKSALELTFLVAAVFVPAAIVRATVERPPANAGTLDPTFAQAGSAEPFPGQRVTAAGMALLPDGQFVVAGTAGSSAFDVAVTRFRSDGRPDHSFANGLARTRLENEDSIGRGVVAQPDGKVVVAGYFGNLYSGRTSAFLLRYRLDGTLDPTFGRDGKATFAFAAYDTGARALALQPSGKILLVTSTRETVLQLPTLVVARVTRRACWTPRSAPRARPR